MSRQRKPYPKTCKTNSGPSPPPQLSSLTVKKTVYSARNGAPKKAEELYLRSFVSKKREMAQPITPPLCNSYCKWRQLWRRARNEATMTPPWTLLFSPSPSRPVDCYQQYTPGPSLRHTDCPLLLPWRPIPAPQTSLPLKTTSSWVAVHVMWGSEGVRAWGFEGVERRKTDIDDPALNMQQCVFNVLHMPVFTGKQDYVPFNIPTHNKLSASKLTNVLKLGIATRFNDSAMQPIN